MIPHLIVQAASSGGIDLIAITDHNSSANVCAVQKAAQGTSLAVLPGMELQTREEVHLLCLFDEMKQLDELQERVDQILPPRINDIDYFGEQFIVDETGDFIGRENRLLISSCQIDFEEAIAFVNDLDGLAIPAHVDRKAYGLFTNLGFLPAGVDVPAMEISPHTPVSKAHQNFPIPAGIPVIVGGDVHNLDDFLGATEFYLHAPTIQEIKLALTGSQGRTYRIRTEYVDNQHTDV